MDGKRKPKTKKDAGSSGTGRKSEEKAEGHQDENMITKETKIKQHRKKKSHTETGSSNKDPKADRDDKASSSTDEKKERKKHNKKKAEKKNGRKKIPEDSRADSDSIVEGKRGQGDQGGEEKGKEKEQGKDENEKRRKITPGSIRVLIRSPRVMQAAGKADLQLPTRKVTEEKIEKAENMMIEDFLYRELAVQTWLAEVLMGKGQTTEEEDDEIQYQYEDEDGE